MECKPVFFHNIRLYKVRIHLWCKKDAKFASGLEAQKPKNPIFLKLCKAHVVSQHLRIFSSYPNLAASGQHTCFCLFYAFAPKFLV